GPSATLEPQASPRAALARSEPAAAIAKLAVTAKTANHDPGRSAPRLGSTRSSPRCAIDPPVISVGSVRRPVRVRSVERSLTRVVLIGRDGVRAAGAARAVFG